MTRLRTALVALALAACGAADTADTLEPAANAGEAARLETRVETHEHRGRDARLRATYEGCTEDFASEVATTIDNLRPSIPAITQSGDQPDLDTCDLVEDR